MVGNGDSQIVTKAPGGYNIDAVSLIEKFGESRIEAIKYVRDQTGLGLKDVKELVDAAYDRRPLVEPTQTAPRQADPRELVSRFGNRKIEAIKYVRDQTGLGLKEAKDFVDAAYGDALRDQAGGTYARSEEPNNGPEIIDKPRRWPVIVIGLAIIVIGLATAAYYMLSFAA